MQEDFRLECTHRASEWKLPGTHCTKSHEMSRLRPLTPAELVHQTRNLWTVIMQDDGLLKRA